MIIRRISDWPGYGLRSPFAELDRMRKEMDQLAGGLSRGIFREPSAGVFPLMNKDGLLEKADELYHMLVNEGFTVDWDSSGSIGRRYARSDEVGTPLAITIDYQTLEDNTVTLRDRDNWRQIRSKITNLPLLLNDFFCKKIDLEDLDKL